MAYQATILPVMIASPGDVNAEREIAREVLHEWNDVNAATSKVVLTSVGWETHSSPELGARPQEIINTRLLKDCDLLIGVFWTRLGTPTGSAPSGTVEEIREHVQAGKPAMLYFSSKPVAPQSIDASQFAAVQEFKEECKSLGLIEEYDDEQDFRRKLAKQLQVTLLRNEYIRGAIGESQYTVTPPDSAEELEIGISADAQQLLKAAASEKSGTILNVRHMGGHDIQAGGKTFGGAYGRESAQWENALNELIEFELVVDRGYKGKVFEITHRGWLVADKL